VFTSTLETRWGVVGGDEPPISLTLTAMAEGGPSGQRPGRVLARLEAEDESALAPLLRFLAGDPLRAVAKLLPDAELTPFRLVCTAFRDHSSKPEKKCRVDFLRTRALLVYAWERMPGFVVARWRMLRLAASVGCVGVLEELVDNRQCELANACATAARKGHLDALAWLHSRGCPWDDITTYNAARGGHLEVLRYAHEHGCSWDSATCYLAAQGGHLEVLQYAHEHGCEWYGETCSRAAAGGHLEVLRYAHEHGCPWTGFTCNFAAEGGHLEVLQYAHEHGCPWGISTCYNAAHGGHLEALRYAHEHGCPLVLEICRAVALRNGHAEVAEYLRAAEPAA
jgi:hypothetical protein